MIDIVELDERINKCLSILQANPRSRIFAALAEAYRRRGDVGRAFSICKNGLRLHPDYGAAHVVMSKLYLHQNMIDQARQAVDRTIELDGQSRSTDLVLTELHLEAGNLDHAREILSRLQQAGGQDPVVAELGERLRTQVQQEEPSEFRRTSPSISRPSGSTGSVKTPRLDEVTIVAQIPQNPTEVVREIAGISQVLCCVLWQETEGRTGSEPVAQAKLDRELGTRTEEVWQLLGDLTDQLEQAGWGSLFSVRVETSRRQWGLVRTGQFIGWTWGTVHMKYTAVIRKLTDRLAGLTALATEESEQEELPAAAERPNS